MSKVSNKQRLETLKGWLSWVPKQKPYSKTNVKKK